MSTPKTGRSHKSNSDLIGNTSTTQIALTPYFNYVTFNATKIHVRRMRSRLSVSDLYNTIYSEAPALGSIAVVHVHMQRNNTRTKKTRTHGPLGKCVLHNYRATTLNQICNVCKRDRECCVMGFQAWRGGAHFAKPLKRVSRAPPRRVCDRFFLREVYMYKCIMLYESARELRVHYARSHNDITYGCYKCDAHASQFICAWWVWH